MYKKQQIFNQLIFAQLLAVFVWLLITVVQWTKNPNNSPGITIPIIVRGIEAIAVFIVSGGFIFFINKTRFRIKPIVARILLLIAIYLLAIIANVISLTLRKFLGFTPPKIDNYFFIQSLHFYIPLLLVFVVYYFVKNRIELQLEKEDKLRAEGLAQQAKWMMLRYQVNPHFLFNALNTIRALIGNDDEKARKIVTGISDYFRYSLSIEKKSLVTVYEELNAVENYLEIQILRFPERLRITKDVNEDTLNCLIPIFTVQTLIENAIKYGLKTHEGIVDIGIQIITENGKLLIQISNSGRLVANKKQDIREDGTNTGLENLKERLLLIDNQSQLYLTENNGKVLAKVFLKISNSNEKLENHYR